MGQLADPGGWAPAATACVLSASTKPRWPANGSARVAVPTAHIPRARWHAITPGKVPMLPGGRAKPTRRNHTPTHYYVLNSAVIPQPGTYSYALLSLAEAVEWLRSQPWQSRVGYPATAEHIQRIAGIRPALSRERTEMAPGDKALVVRLKYRIENPADKRTWQPAPDDWEYGLLARLS